MNPLFSIIIPHRDIPDLLMRCLDSIPVAEDIQVIVVDDHSSDAHTYLDRYPALSRPNVEFIPTTAGRGAGYARNVGLDHAKGEWLLFADSDDLFVDGMHDLLLSYADSEADLIFFKKKSVLSDDVHTSVSRADYLNQYIDDYFKTGDERYVRLRYCSPWGKMVRRKFVSEYGFRFDEIKYSNDYYFSFCVGHYAKQIAVSDRILYVYTSRPGSLSALFCSKPNELAIRAEVAFRVEREIKRSRVGIEQQRPFRWYLGLMLKRDRKLFKTYYLKFNELYASSHEALLDICEGKNVLLRICVYLYLQWLKLTTNGK